MWDSYECTEVLPGGALLSCESRDAPWAGEYLETNDPGIFKSLMNWTLRDDGYKGIAMMVALLVRHDAGYSRGTHSAMNRYVARLAKLIRVLEGSTLTLEGRGYHIISFLDMFPKAKSELKAALTVLTRYRDSYHRVRDRVHELMYPIIRRALEDLMAITIVHRVDEGYHRKVFLVHKAEANPYTLEYRVETELQMDIPRRLVFERLPLWRATNLVNKLIERRRRNPLAARNYRHGWNPWTRRVEEALAAYMASLGGSRGH